MYLTNPTLYVHNFEHGQVGDRETLSGLGSP